MDFVLTSILLLVALEDAAAGYKTYTVERDCVSGNLALNLNASGPDSAVLLRTTDRTSYSVAGKCRIQVKTTTDRIVASIREVGFRTRLDGSCQDFIQIESPMCSYLYRVEEERHFYSGGNTLEILHYVSENYTDGGYPGAKLTLTAQTAGSESFLGEDGFECRNGFCIWSGLKCDSHNNCGDRTDEQDCGSSGGSQSTALIILAVVIVALLLIMCVATLLCSKNETVRRFSNRLRSRTLSYLPRFSR